MQVDEKRNESINLLKTSLFSYFNLKTRPSLSLFLLLYTCNCDLSLLNF